MTEDITARMLRILQDTPDSKEMTEFQHALENDARSRQIWEDFLLEHYLTGEMTADWHQYVDRLPAFEENLRLHQDVRVNIRALHDETRRQEIRHILPKHDIGEPLLHPNRRVLVLAISIAAGVLVLVGAMFWLLRPDSAMTSGETPVLMVEEFEFEGVTEEEIVNSIAQRIPAKLSAAEGIYPVTHFAMTNASGQMQIIRATHTVRGRITRIGGQLRVEASLVDIEKNLELWKTLFATSDDPKAFDDIQDSMSLRIAHTLDIDMPTAARARLGMEISRNAHAVSAFLRGERLFADRTLESLPQAMEMFEMASELDPQSPLIYGYLALAYGTYAENGWGDSTYWDRALEAAENALKIDPENPEALIVLGDYQEMVEKDYARAEGYFNRALHQQPSDAKIHQAIAELHLRTGDIAAGIQHIRFARKAEPWHRVVRWVETKYLTASGRLEDALTAAEDLMQMHPDFPYIKNFYWQYHLSRGEHELALETIPKDSPESSQLYMEAIVHLDRMDYDSFNEVYAKLPSGMQPSLELLSYVQKDLWESAHALLHKMLAEDEFSLIALFQTSDFAVFNKMKSDRFIQQILAEYGIRVHQIPDEPGPEM